MPNTLTDAPIASHTLAQDQPLMEANNAYYGNTLFVDHQIGPANGTRNDGLAKEGYHKVIHYVTAGADPVAIAGVGQLYTLTVGGDQRLKYRSGNGILTLLTGPTAPSPGANGFTWLPGGIMIQWGTGGLGSSSSQQNFVFPTPFPTNCFNVQCTPTYSGGVPGGAAGVAPRASTVSVNGFSFLYQTNASNYTDFFWVAIGN